MVSMKEVKKGALVTLANGWTAIVLDNLTNRQTRLCEVHGFVTEMGSVYSSDIMKVSVDGKWVDVRHSESVKRAAKGRRIWGL